MSAYPHIQKRIVILASLVGMMGMFLIGLTVSMTYTYSSKAAGIPSSLVRTEDSSNPVRIQNKDLPVCVTLLQYFQTQDGLQCITDIECSKAPAEVASTCILHSKTLECTLSSSACSQKEKLIDEVSKICGC